jgi:MFS family permease
MIKRLPPEIRCTNRLTDNMTTSDRLEYLLLVVEHACPCLEGTNKRKGVVMSDGSRKIDWLSDMAAEGGPEGWHVVVTAALGVGVGLLGLPLLTVGLFMGPLHADFGWSRAQVAGASFCINVATLLAAPFIGRLCDRIGVRPVALGSLMALCAGFLALAAMNGSITLYYVLWLALAGGSAGSTGIVWTRAIGTLFDRNRGKALGMTLAGTAFAALLGPLALGPIIGAFGWRGGYLALAAVSALAIPATYYWFFERRSPEETAGLSPARQDASGLTRGEALRKASFWKMGTGLFLVVLGMGSFLVHFVPLAVDAGIKIQVATRFFSIIGLSMLFGRIVIGFLLDRLHAPYVAAVALCLPALACWILIGTGPNWMAFAAAAAIIGFCAGAEIDLIAYLVSRYFGMRAYGEIYGCQMVFFAAGSGLGGVLTGHIRDAYGSYDPALYGGIGVFVLGAIIIGSMGPVPVFERYASNSTGRQAEPLPAGPALAERGTSPVKC